jgi:hypothetical protein
MRRALPEQGHAIRTSGTLVTLGASILNFCTSAETTQWAIVGAANPALAVGLAAGLVGASLSKRSRKPEVVQRRLLVAGAAIGAVSSVLLHTDWSAGFEMPLTGSEAFVPEVHGDMAMPNVAEVAASVAGGIAGTATAAYTMVGPPAPRQPEPISYAPRR